MAYTMARVQSNNCILLLSETSNCRYLSPSHCLALLMVSFLTWLLGVVHRNTTRAKV